MKHEEQIRRLSLEEKCVLLSGKDVWQTKDYPHAGIPSIWLSDGPHGLRKQAGAADHLGLNASEKATCFPTAATIAGSWDPALGEAIGQALGVEAAAGGVNVVLGPGLNMKRSPLCGRNFEYFAEDPYLAGKLAAGYIRGIQKNGVGACPKHFAANNQELRRMASDSVIDERTLREIYLTGFEIAVKEGAPKAIMSAYNAVNGVYANENPLLLQTILREEWGFDGAVITDWGGSNDHVAGVRCGSSLEMPSPGLSSAQDLVDAVKSGKLAQSSVDERVDEVLELVFSTTAALQAQHTPFDADAHHALARRAAAESMILLKNEQQLLPLPAGAKVALIGDFATAPRYQGAGSSMVNPTRLDVVANLMQEEDLVCTAVEAGYLRDGRAEQRLCEQAAAAAKTADTVLLFLGLAESDEAEGMDRAHMRMAENQREVLHEIAAVNPHIVVVLSAGSAVEMDWAADCQALVHGYLGGQSGARAVLDVLTGRVCPSGKLAETLPLHEEDTPAYRYFPGTSRAVEYREGLYIGYRYYDTAGVPVAFPFGFGLSYTTFAYRDLQLTPQAVRFTLENTGACAGAEVAQVYIGKAGGTVFRPAKELKGFAKVFLQPGESKTVTIHLDDKAYRYWNVKTNHWEIEGGAYQIYLGASSADIRLQGSVAVAGTNAPDPYAELALPAYRTGKIAALSAQEFAALLGREATPGKVQIDENTAIRDLIHCRSPLGWLVWLVLTALERDGRRKGKPNLNVLFIYNMPIRGLAKMTGGAFSMEMVRGLVAELKGFWIIGLVRVAIGAVQMANKNKRMIEKLNLDARDQPA